MVGEGDLPCGGTRFDRQRCICIIVPACLLPLLASGQSLAEFRQGVAQLRPAVGPVAVSQGGVARRQGRGTTRVCPPHRLTYRQPGLQVIHLHCRQTCSRGSLGLQAPEQLLRLVDTILGQQEHDSFKGLHRPQRWPPNSSRQEGCPRPPQAAVLNGGTVPQRVRSPIHQRPVLCVTPSIQVQQRVMDGRPQVARQGGHWQIF
mmetsp:Transcript_17790/g.53601  ORF Transcript_17790/g.53601 Transcript_17790/m.53601 type:complete len:203 (-) Transcript_17790:5910-6518(-)